MADYKEQGVYQEGNSLFDDIFAFGDLEVQNINVVGIITAKTFSGVDATSLKDDNGNVKIQATTTGATHSGRAVFYDLEIQNKIYDGQGEFGDAGKVLSSTGAGVTWANAGSLAAGSAAQVTVANEATDTTCFPTFVTGATGNLQAKSNANLTFNSSNGALSATSFSGSGANLTNIPAAQLTGTIASGRLTGTYGINISGNAGSSDTVDVTSETSTSTTQYLLFTHTHGSQLTIKQDTGLSYVPSTNQLTASGGFFGDLEGNVTATTISGTLQTGAQTNITSVGTLTGLAVDGNVNIDNTSKYLSLKGALLDKDGQTGATNEVLTSTGTQVEWKPSNTLTASNSIKITITEDDTNSDFPITFSESPGQTGGNDLLSDNQFTYNAFTNIVTAGTFSGSGASLTSLNANNINSGTLADARLTDSSLFEQGMIMMWYGSVASIPSGWVLCDGNNNTPDLRNRFVVGAGTGGNYSPGDRGGADSVTLTIDQIPAHSHVYQNQVAVVNANERPWPANNNDCRLDDANTSSTGGDSNGNTVAHENRPPYHALCYIMKT